MRAAAVLCLLIVSQARAQSYENSPHVEGDSASVRVYYDQRVNTTHVKKDVFIYNGPKADEVLSAVRSIVSEQQAELATLVNKDDEETLRADLLHQLNKRFDSQPDITESLQALLAEREPQHCGYWDVSVGVSSVFAGGPALGGSGRLGGSLDMLTVGEFRQALGVRLGLEVLERDQWSRPPDGRELDPGNRMSFQGWIEPGYEVWWVGKHVGLQLGLLLGAQAFEAGAGSRPYVTYGLTLGPQVHLGPEDDSGVRVGVQWRMASMTRPVFDFQVLEYDNKPERKLQHILMVYAGLYFGLFS